MIFRIVFIAFTFFGFGGTGAIANVMMDHGWRCKRREGGKLGMIELVLNSSLAASPCI